MYLFYALLSHKKRIKESHKHHKRLCKSKSEVSAGGIAEESYRDARSDDRLVVERTADDGCERRRAYERYAGCEGCVGIDPKYGAEKHMEEECS